MLGVHLVSGRIPARAQKRVLDGGGTKEEALAAFKNKDLSLYLVNRKTAPALAGGWHVLAFILAIIGSYPQRAVTLSWTLVVSVFIFKLFETHALDTEKDSKFSLFSLLVIPATFAMLGALVWLLIITVQVVFL